MPPHDQIFKGLLKAFLSDFLRLVVPDLASRLDLAHAVFLDKEFFTDTGRGRRRELDLLVRVPLLPGGERSVLIHVEIEARATTDIARRLWSYRNQIQARHDCQVLSIVVFVARGTPGVRLAHLPGDLHGPELGDFRYVALGLAGGDAAEYLARPEPLAWALAALMRSPSASRAEHKLACLRRIAGADLTEPEGFLLVNCVETYLELNPDEAAEYQSLRSRQKNREVHAMATTWADRMKAEGRAEGLREGREGCREILLHLLALRFGPLSDAVLRKVEAIPSIERLTRLSEQVLVAGSLEELDLR